MVAVGTAQNTTPWFSAATNAAVRRFCDIFLFHWVLKGVLYSILSATLFRHFSWLATSLETSDIHTQHWTVAPLHEVQSPRSLFCRVPIEIWRQLHVSIPLNSFTTPLWGFFVNMLRLQLFFLSPKHYTNNKLAVQVESKWAMCSQLQQHVPNCFCQNIFYLPFPLKLIAGLNTAGDPKNVCRKLWQ